MNENELEKFINHVLHGVKNLERFNSTDGKYVVDDNTYFIHLKYKSRHIVHDLSERFYANFKNVNEFNLPDLKSNMLRELIDMKNYSHYEINIVKMSEVKSDIGHVLESEELLKCKTDYSIPAKLVFEYDNFYEVSILILLHTEQVEKNIKANNYLNIIKHILKESVGDKIKLKDVAFMPY